jgi:Domain of unknown function (DUF4375)
MATVEDTRPQRMSQAQLGRLKPGELYKATLAPIWDRIPIYDDPNSILKALAATPKPQALLFAAHWCQSEVCNGGLHQFFYNSTGILAPEAEAAFRFIGLPVAADALASAVRMFGPDYPRARELRLSRLRTLERLGDSRPEWDPFFDLDEVFYSVAGPPAFETCADSFVRANMDLFFRDVHE